MLHTMDLFFCPPDGRIFNCFPNAEARAGQRRMAELVADSIQSGIERFETWNKVKLVNPEAEKPDALLQAIEAGTGIGKSLGYLIPALASKRYPILVATRTKQLQQQLLDDDLTRAQHVTGCFVNVVLAKGRNNYLCRAAWKEMESNPPMDLAKTDYELWLSLIQWAKITKTGDREELGKHGEGKSDLWERINAKTERCPGSKCPSFHNCYLTKLRNQILKADLVIANHALLLANQGLQNSDFGNVLPEAPVLILDEAHEIEQQLTESCAEQWSSRAMSMLISDINNEFNNESEAILMPWKSAWDDVLSLLPQHNGIFKLINSEMLSTSLKDTFDVWLRIGKTIYEQITKLSSNKGNGNDLIYHKLIERINLALSSMELIFTQPEGWVSIVSIEESYNVIFKTNPIDIKPFFHQYLRRSFETVILTSATLRDGCGFNGLKLRLGFSNDEAARSQYVESPFDFEQQGLLFVPPNIPARNYGRDSIGDIVWIDACCSTMERLITVSKGRALLLFTSRKMLAAFRPRLEASLPGITFFVQGEAMARSTMIKRFQRTPNAVLLGLSSFWQGIDVPGKALSLVIITALPFLPPDDPILQSRIREADAIQKGLGFLGIQVPQMTIKLKQGIGRLIRNSSDRGAICILDPRIMLPHEDPNGKRYAAQVRAALPAFPFSRDWDEIESFLQSL